MTAIRPAVQGRELINTIYYAICTFNLVICDAILHQLRRYQLLMLYRLARLSSHFDNPSIIFQFDRLHCKINRSSDITVKSLPTVRNDFDDMKTSFVSDVVITVLSLIVNYFSWTVGDSKVTPIVYYQAFVIGLVGSCSLLGSQLSSR